MKTDVFAFDLPRDLIAERPARPRDAARLLVVRPDSLEDRVVHDLPDFLKAGDVLIVNDTKVIPARLRGHRGIAKVQVTLMEPAAEAGHWHALARPAKKLKLGDRIDFAPDFAATVAARGDAGEITLAFERDGAALMDALDQHGETPLPPYIPRENGADAQDRADYQTVYAREPGAVAAPTAGLHFTPELLAALAAKGIGRETVTLHVGAGTFLPMTAEDTDDHRMHAERGMITPDVAARINAARAKGGRIVAVGTTALRLLESAANENGQVLPFTGSTAIFITPGYRFKAVDVLMTNFHLPRSTLFMLVSAFAGLARMQSAYAHAIQSRYRFYSYGDASLLFRAESA
jgi:S-adenosylmethionine:tRNA ribosyltransferase-isomerase